MRSPRSAPLTFGITTIAITLAFLPVLYAYEWWLKRKARK